MRCHPVLLALLLCGCAFDQTQTMDDDAPDTPRGVTHIVEHQPNWTTRGNFDALAYVAVDRPRSGKVFCNVREHLRDGTIADEPSTTMTGEVADGWVQQGPSGPVWAVPVTLDSGHVKKARMVYVRCEVGRRPALGSAWDAYFGLRPVPQSDLSLAPHIHVVDCQSEAVPQAGQETCIRLSHNRPRGLVAPQIQVACELSGPTRAPRLVTSLPPEQLDAIAMAPVVLDPGNYDLRCSTDAADVVDEADEANNTVSKSFAVVRPIPASAYTLKLGALSYVRLPPPTLPRFAGGENGLPPLQPRDGLVVEVKNTGPRADVVRVTCNIGEKTYSSDFVGPAPGSKIDARLWIQPEPAGPLTAACEASVVSPRVAAPLARRSLRLTAP